MQHLDHYWRDHLTQLEHLRQGIGCVVMLKKDPKQEYKKESFNLFAEMLDGIKQDIVKVLFTVRLQGMDDVPNEDTFDDVDETHVSNIHREPTSALGADSGEQQQTISRNAPCPCGSGKKYKHCHGAFSLVRLLLFF